MGARLEIDAAELGGALVPFAQLLKSKKPPGDALIGLEDGMLRIEAGGITTKAKADGDWPGEARVPAIFISSIAARGFAKAGRAELTVEDAKLILRVGSTMYEKACVWETSDKPGIHLPMNPGLTDLLALHFKHTPAEIERAGATAQVAVAVERLESMVEEVVEAMEDLGTSEDEVLAMVKASVLKRQ